MSPNFGISEIITLQVLTFGIALAYSFFNKTKFAFSISLLIVATTVFLYSSIQIFFGEIPNLWFEEDPPWFVSKVTQVLLGCIAALQLYRIGGFWFTQTWKQEEFGPVTIIVAVMVSAVNVESYRRRAALDRKRGPGRPPVHATTKNTETADD